MAPIRPIKKVIVLGATGNVGSPIIDALIAHPAGYAVTAVTRDKTKSSFPFQVKVVESDLSPSSIRNAFEGQDAVVSCVPPAWVARQDALIDAAIECGVTRYIPSEFGMDSANPESPKYTDSSRWKIKTREYLSGKEDQISWTAVVVGLFFDWSLNVGFGGWDVRNHKATIYDGGDVELEASNVAKIGEAVATVLSPEYQESTANQMVYVNSFTTTQNEVLASLQKATGRTFEITQDTTQRLRDSALERQANDPADVSAIVDKIVASFYGQGGINLYSKDPAAGLWNDRLGLRKERLEETVHRVVTSIQ